MTVSKSAHQFPVGPIIEPGSPLDLTTVATGNLGIYTKETTQRYTLGTRYITWDGRVFKYAKAGGTLNVDVGAKDFASQNLAFVSPGAAAAVGDRSVIAVFGAADGYANSGLVAENELAGGYVVIYSDTGAVDTMLRGIVGNTGVAAGGGNVTLYLDWPLHEAVATASSFIEAIASPYLDVRESSDGTKTVVGMPVVDAAAAEFSWLQTYGITWCAPQSGVGATTLVRAVYFRHDGSLDIRSNVGTNVTDQRAGFVMENTQAGGQAAPFIMLQISI